MPARRADFTSLRRAGLRSKEKRSSTVATLASPSGGPERTASASVAALARSSPDPAARQATLYSSSAFQFVYDSISGWSASRMTILAARRVVPPDLIAPAERSAILRKDRSPLETPP